jgi:penicillin-insensitive murein DD-endopeptidase
MSRPSSPRSLWCVVAIALLALIALAPAARAHSVRELPAMFRHAPYSLMSLTVGYPNDGWQVRAKKVKRSRYLHIEAGSRDHCYGHPALVLMLERSARAIARAVPGSVMLVGDLSRQDGGPLAGHHSHQSGRDADVSYYMRDARGRLFVPKHFVHFDAAGKATDGSGITFDERRNWLLVQTWLRDKRAGIAHIFVADWLRKRLLDYARRDKASKKYEIEAAELMMQPENAENHDDHFHVRIACPKHEQAICHEESRPR